MFNNDRAIALDYDLTDTNLMSFANALQISDTFFPVGMYNFSHGLETFVQSGLVNDFESVVSLLKDILSNQIGPADCVALANVYRAGKEPDVSTILLVDEMLYSMKLSNESRESSVKTGKCLLSNMLLMLSDKLTLSKFNDRVCAKDTPGNYAVVLGLSGYLLGISCSQVMIMELYSFCVSFVSAAMRLLRINHYESIKIINGLNPLFLEIVKENIYKTPNEMFSCTPLVDVMSIKHEQATTRMFLS